MIKKMKNNVLIRELVGSGRHVLSQLDRSAVFTGSSFIYIYLYGHDMSKTSQEKQGMCLPKTISLRLSSIVSLCLAVKLYLFSSISIDSKDVKVLSIASVFFSSKLLIFMKHPIKK